MAETEIDLERAVVLLDLIHKISTITPQNTGLLGVAQAELRKIEDEAKQILADRREAAAQAEADARAAAAQEPMAEDEDEDEEDE